MTRKVLEKLNSVQINHINKLRNEYNKEVCSQFCSGLHRERVDMARRCSHEYINGLRDSGILTYREAQVLFIYTTV